MKTWQLSSYRLHMKESVAVIYFVFEIPNQKITLWWKQQGSDNKKWNYFVLLTAYTMFPMSSRLASEDKGGSNMMNLDGILTALGDFLGLAFGKARVTFPSEKFRMFLGILPNIRMQAPAKESFMGSHPLPCYHFNPIHFHSVMKKKYILRWPLWWRTSFSWFINSDFSWTRIIWSLQHMCWGPHI